MSKQLITGLIGTLVIFGENEAELYENMDTSNLSTHIENDFNQALFAAGVITRMSYNLDWIAVKPIRMNIYGVISKEKLYLLANTLPTESKYTTSNSVILGYTWIPNILDEIPEQHMINILSNMIKSDYQPQNVDSHEEFKIILRERMDKFPTITESFGRIKIAFDIFMILYKNLGIVYQDYYAPFRVAIRNRYAQNALECDMIEVKFLDKLVQKYIPLVTVSNP